MNKSQFRAQCRVLFTVSFLISNTYFILNYNLRHFIFAFISTFLVLFLAKSIFTWFKGFLKTYLLYKISLLIQHCFSVLWNPARFYLILSDPNAKSVAKKVLWNKKHILSTSLYLSWNEIFFSYICTNKSWEKQIYLFKSQ